MAQIYHLAIVLIAVTTALHAGSSGSSESLSLRQEQQKIDIYGQLTDKQGYTFSFNNLSIAGAIEAIPFYQKPHCLTDNAHLNERLLNLADIREIRTPQTESSCNVQEIYMFNNRHYIDIIITLTDGTEHKYIVETSRRIFCNEVNTRQPQTVILPAKIAFQSLDKLVIQGYRTRQDLPKETPLVSPQAPTSNAQVDSFLKHVRQEVDRFLELEEKKINEFLRQQQPFMVSCRKTDFLR